MRKKIKVLGIALCSLFCLQAVHAQDTMGDQNPNYRTSLDKYMVLKDSITQNFSTTSQETYKAYDWYEAKAERKALKKQYRHEERMARAQNGGYYSSGYDNSYYGYNGYSGYGNYRRNWGANLIPHIGFNTGNWSFYW